MIIKMTILNEHIGIRQFFTSQNFPNSDSSKFSLSKFCTIQYNNNNIYIYIYIYIIIIIIVLQMHVIK